MKRENAAKRYYKKNMIISIVVFVPMILFFTIVALPFIDKGQRIFELFELPIIMAAVAIPFIIYYVVKFIHYSNVNFINIKKGKVVNSESYNYGRHGTYVGFVVEYEDDMGDKHRVTTKHCHTKADGYFGVTVTIGQNPKNGEWIILE